MNKKAVMDGYLPVAFLIKHLKLATSFILKGDIRKPAQTCKVIHWCVSSYAPVNYFQSQSAPGRRGNCGLSPLILMPFGAQ